MRTWRELRRPLGAIAEGLWRPVPERTLTYFRVIWSLHICVEESAVYSIARHRLAPPERAGPAARGGDRVTEPSPL